MGKLVRVIDWILRFLHTYEPSEQARLTARRASHVPSGSFTTPTATTCLVRLPGLKMGTAPPPRVMEQMGVPMLEVTLRGRDQLTIVVSQATPADALSLSNQSAMQLGLILPVMNRVPGTSRWVSTALLLPAGLQR